MISRTFLTIREPVMTKVPPIQCRVNVKVSTERCYLPVAHGGILAKIGAKKMEMKNAIPVVTPAMPVFAPSAIPVDDSTNGVTGDVPKRALNTMHNPSTQ